MMHPPRWPPQAGTIGGYAVAGRSEIMECVTADDLEEDQPEASTPEELVVMLSRVAPGVLGPLEADLTPAGTCLLVLERPHVGVATHCACTAALQI